MQNKEALKVLNYYTKDEIKNLLKNVQYIIMATPAPNNFKDTPIHFTIFLNTNEELPAEIKDAVFEKFLKEHSITKTNHIFNQLAPVGFAKTSKQTPMPLFLVEPKDIRSIEHIYLHVIDFLGDSENFDEVKKDSLTGWSYVYD